jgi:hypothetical protein
MSALSAGVVLGTARASFPQKSGRVSTAIETQTRAALPLEAQQDPVFLFTHATFDSYVGDIFLAPNARGEMISLTLLKVNTYRPERATRLATKPSPETDCFSLTFKAADQLPPFTSIHKVNHPALGNFDLFLTPRQSGSVIYYEAVINHIR